MKTEQKPITVDRLSHSEWLDEMVKTPWGIGRIYEISGAGSDEHVKIDINRETHIMNMGEIDEHDIVR